MVMDQLSGMIGEVTRLVIDTTSTLRLEKKAEEVLAEKLEAEAAQLNASQAALVSIDGTGAIRGASSAAGTMPKAQFDRASRRSASLARPSSLVYAAALESAARRCPCATTRRSGSATGHLKTMIRNTRQ